MPASLDQVMAMTALVQCLVTAISAEIDGGTFQSEYHPMMVQQNKWRATRYGAKADLVSTQDFQQKSVQEFTNHLLKQLTPYAVDLNCEAELQAVRGIPENSGALQQLKYYEQTGSRREVVRRMIKHNSWDA